MLENKTEEQAKEEILAMVAEYCDKFKAKPPYKEGDRIPYASISSFACSSVLFSNIQSVLQFKKFINLFIHNSGNISAVKIYFGPFNNLFNCLFNAPAWLPAENCFNLSCIKP